MTEDVLLVFSTAASSEEGIGIGRRLVEERLAACVSVVASARSLYWWQGEVQEADEAVLMIKTRRDRYPELERRLQALNSYTVPEIVAVPIAAGSAAYLGWVRDNASPGGGGASP
jgi:periplasmic divalent cation tolerance protein